IAADCHTVAVCASALEPVEAEAWKVHILGPSPQRPGGQGYARSCRYTPSGIRVGRPSGTTDRDPCAWLKGPVLRCSLAAAGCLLTSFSSVKTTDVSIIRPHSSHRPAFLSGRAT